jgi:hypothetical protein
VNNHSPHPNAPAIMPARKRPRKSDRDGDGDSFRGFKIKITPSKPGRPCSRKKAKLDSAEKITAQSDAVLVQEKPFPEAKLIAIQYKIEPEAVWNSLRRYRAITRQFTFTRLQISASNHAARRYLESG